MWLHKPDDSSNREEKCCEHQNRQRETIFDARFGLGIWRDGIEEERQADQCDQAAGNQRPNEAARAEAMGGRAGAAWH